jgi:hypothetical protein
VDGFESKEFQERADDETDFELAQVLSGTDAWAVAKTKVQEILRPAT